MNWTVPPANITRPAYPRAAYLLAIAEQNSQDVKILSILSILQVELFWESVEKMIYLR